VGFRSDPSAAWPPVEIFTNGWDGNVRRYADGAEKVLAKPCAEGFGIFGAPGSPTLVVSCSPKGAEITDVHRVDRQTGAATRLDMRLAVKAGGVMSPDGRYLLTYRPGACPMPAPVCQSRLILTDVVSGSEREALAGYHLGATFAWTPLGLTMFQPECAEAGCSGIGDAGGTFVWNGSAFVKHSPMKFVTSAGPYRLYERTHSYLTQERRVLLSGPAGELTLTPADQREQALSVTPQGDVRAWRFGSGQSSWIVGYDAAGRVTSQVEAEGQTPTAVGDDLVVAALYNFVGNPALVVFDMKRLLRFDVAGSGARSWITIRR
jgi:hypothetical protein